MATPTPQQLEDTYDAIIVEQSTTFAEQSPQYSTAELKGAITGTRSALREAATNLPDAAYEPQPANADGNEVWSAGQVVSHVTGTLWGISGRALDTAELENPGPSASLEDYKDRPLNREESIAALDAGDAAAEQLFVLIPDDADLSATVDNDFFGEMSAKSWLMFVSVHEADHVGQLNELMDA